MHAACEASRALGLRHVTRHDVYVFGVGWGGIRWFVTAAVEYVWLASPAALQPCFGVQHV
jgi:hypothetical protein